MTVTIGAVLRGKYKNNANARAVVWGINPNNPKRVVLWLKTERFSWNSVESVEDNYEPAPADEPRWANPTRDPQPDPHDRQQEATPLEAAATSAPAPVTPANDEPEPPTDEPPPPPAPANDDEAEVRIVLRGDTARVFLAILNDRREVLADLGGENITPESLVRGFMRMELRRLGKEVA